MIVESEIDVNTIYFHGSNNGKIDRFNPPSYSKPLFVTSDIDYANSYLEAVTVDGHSQFKEDADNGKIYIVSLNAPKINLFDATKSSDIASLKNVWPDYIIKSLELRKYSIWSVFRYMLPMLATYYSKSIGKNADKFKTLAKKEFVDELGVDLLVDGIIEIDKKRGHDMEKIFHDIDMTSRDSMWHALFQTISIFNKSLLALGYNAFRNIERKKKIQTNDAIGLMTPETIDSLVPKPLPKDMVERALDSIKSGDNQSANDQIREVLKEIKKS